MKTVKLPIKLTLTVKRPNGEIEKVIHPSLKWIDDNQFKQIQKGTKEAGRGEVLSYEIEYKTSRVITSMSEIIAAGQDRTVENMSRMGE